MNHINNILTSLQTIKKFKFTTKITLYVNISNNKFNTNKKSVKEKIKIISFQLLPLQKPNLGE